MEQRLARSVDLKEAQTRNTWLVHFLKFISHYNKWDVYLTNDINVTNEILTNYMTFLLSGFTKKILIFAQAQPKDILRWSVFITNSKG